MKTVRVKGHTRKKYSMRREFTKLELNYDYFVRAARSIVREMRKANPDLGYIMEKIRVLEDFIRIAKNVKRR